MNRALLSSLACLLLCSCSDKPAIKFGPVCTTGPARGPNEEILENAVTFHYAAEASEPAHLLVDGKRVKTVQIHGKGKWRIEPKDGQLTISEGSVIFSAPIAHEGTVSSSVSTNASKQIVFDIAVGGNNVMRIECPGQTID